MLGLSQINNNARNLFKRFLDMSNMNDNFNDNEDLKKIVA